MVQIDGTRFQLGCHYAQHSESRPSISYERLGDRPSFAWRWGGAFAQSRQILTDEELDRATSANSLIVTWQDREMARDVQERGHPLLRAVRARVEWVSDLLPGVMTLTLPEGNARVAAEILRLSPDVVLVERDPFVHACSSPNDAYWPTQKPYLLPACLQGAWDKQTTSSNLIAVLDSGAAYNLADLGPNIWINNVEVVGTTGVDDDGNGVIDDYRRASFLKNQADPDWTPPNEPLDLSGHGTEMSSIIGGVGNNGAIGAGYCGINWTCKILPVKIYGAGFAAQQDLASWALAGLEYAYKSGARLMNLSWEVRIDVQSLQTFFQQRTDCLFMCAAGNTSIFLDDPNPIRCGSPLAHSFPAEYSYNNMIVVAGSTPNDQAWFTNACDYGSGYGPLTVDICTPGGSILPVQTHLGTISLSDGTSNSTAVVTGVASLVWAHNPGWSLAQVRTQILNTADQLPNLQWFCAQGRRINAAAALGGTPCQ